MGKVYCIMRMSKIKTKGELTSMMNHNYRLEKVENADPKKQHLNEELISLPQGETYGDAFNRIINSSPAYQEHRPRKDAVKAIEVLTTYSDCGLDEAPDLDEWKKANIEWLQATFGKENVVSAVLHMDERNPHIHAVIIPMKDGRLNAKSFMNGPVAMRAIQDSYAERMAPLGLDRGVKRSAAKHTDIKQFYGQLTAEEAKQLPNVRSGESAQDYRTRAQAVYIKANAVHFREIKQMEQQVASAGGVSLQERLDFQEQVEKLEKRLRSIEERESQLKEAERLSESDKKKIARMDEMMYAIKRGLPTEQEAIEMRQRMEALAKIGQKQMEIDEVQTLIQNNEDVAHRH